VHQLDPLVALRTGVGGQVRDKGLVVVGINTPEFEFEGNLDNVERALKEMDVRYPVAVDNDYAVWQAFDNHYWPALYFVDAEGNVRHHHFGEGEYEESEMVLQMLLRAAGADVDQGLVEIVPDGYEKQADWYSLGTPETYLDDVSAPGGSISIQFHARDLHLVMGPPAHSQPIRFRVTLNGEAPGPAHGPDVDEDGNGTADYQRMYQLIRQPGPIDDRLFKIEFLGPGVEAFVFTFG